MYHLLVIQQLQAFIRTHALFRPGDRVGVAVSGGADSVALLRALLALRSDPGIVLSVVHVHHGIRAGEADDDAQFVSNLAKRFDLALHLEYANVPAHREREKLSMETSARELRYDFFRQLLEQNLCDKIATAHTMDDQAETVLLRILRGTGTRGLTSIPPLRNASPELVARIVRPFLGTSRAEVESYLRSLRQEWREDSSNRDTKHLRNRIRQELLPQLERQYNPAIRQSLVNLAEIARAEEEHWTAQVDDLHSLIESEELGATIDRSRLLALPLALRRRLLVELADELDLAISFDDVELMLHLAANSGKTHKFEGGWQVASSGEKLQIRRAAEAAEVADYDFAVTVPSEIELPGGTRLFAQAVEPNEVARYNAAALLDGDRLQHPLRVRNWQPGDRFWPSGSKQTEKLKRLFQQQHIPPAARVAWPVVLSGEIIVWVRGFPVAHGYEAQKSPAVLIEAIVPGGGESRAK